MAIRTWAVAIPSGQDVPRSLAGELEHEEHSGSGVPSRRPSAPWVRRYLVRAVAIDTVAILCAAMLARLLRFGLSDPALFFHQKQVPYLVVTAMLVPTWLVVMALGGCYDHRLFGSGTDEYRKLMTAGLHFLAVIAILEFVFKIDFARGFVAASIVFAVLFTLLARFALRKRLHRSRAQGRCLQRVLLVGGRAPVEQVARHLARTPWAGFQVVGACSTEPSEPHSLGDDQLLRIVGGIGDVLTALDQLDADVLVVASASVFQPGELRRLSWVLEETGVRLIVAPVVTDIAGPRISTRPVAGLPLLHVEEPRYSVGGKVYKALFDRLVAFVGLIVLAPLLLAAAVAVRCTSRGPVFFRQVRVGLNGTRFTLLKFRTMVRDAEDRKLALLHANDADGVIFKIRRDPRITSVGRVLRRFSIDELPQLLHVLSGKMSLVGPRPPLPDEVARYEGHTHRRLLVRPGLTGLWQVSGRADLSWDESVRLDLHYVDHWSPTMDVAILLKTVGAVLRGQGAY